MQFQGYWVSSKNKGSVVQHGMFDETELSENSKWTEAHQNEDASLDHGFIDPLSMLNKVSKDLTKNIDESEIKKIATQLINGDGICINTINDLSTLIRVAFFIKNQKF
ncbi:hypothetical protein [Brevundimonas sp.]|uniref:hypothetical protein n=1 Tax=Brevundimonas sp. TaxID=1871086 RepID=UPI002897C2AC|nr:hypothetical protein [Brevundimonas sp.]